MICYISNNITEMDEISNIYPLPETFPHIFVDETIVLTPNEFKILDLGLEYNLNPDYYFNFILNPKFENLLTIENIYDDFSYPLPNKMIIYMINISVDQIVTIEKNELLCSIHKDQKSYLLS